METIIIGEPKCPECGCTDLREQHWGWTCFKCDHFLTRSHTTFVEYNQKPKED